MSHVVAPACGCGEFRELREFREDREFRDFPIIPINTHFPHNPHCAAGKALPCNKKPETDNSVGLWFNAIPEAHLVFALGVMRCPYCQMAR